jgi:hypothetical protein
MARGNSFVQSPNLSVPDAYGLFRNTPPKKVLVLEKTFAKINSKLKRSRI